MTMNQRIDRRRSGDRKRNNVLFRNDLFRRVRPDCVNLRAQHELLSILVFLHGLSAATNHHPLGARGHLPSGYIVGTL